MLYVQKKKKKKKNFVKKVKELGLKEGKYITDTVAFHESVFIGLKWVKHCLSFPTKIRWRYKCLFGVNFIIWDCFGISTYSVVFYITESIKFCTFFVSFFFEIFFFFFFCIYILKFKFISMNRILYKSIESAIYNIFLSVIHMYLDK